MGRGKNSLKPSQFLTGTVPRTCPAHYGHKKPWPCLPKSSPVTKTLVLTVAACASSAASASRQGSFMVMERGHGLLAPPPLPSLCSGGRGGDIDFNMKLLPPRLVRLSSDSVSNFRARRLSARPSVLLVGLFFPL